MANWYCKVLKPGREVQQRLIRLEQVADFDEIVGRLSDIGPSVAYNPAEASIAVPSGPIAHW